MHASRCLLIAITHELGEMQVAEDNRINQKVLRMMLHANCAELTIVSDGRQAVDAYNKVLQLLQLLHVPLLW
jgi:CheY-like chemotaxis protein